MSPSEVSKILTLCKGAYPRQTVTKDTMEAYALFLADLDYAACMDAVKRHIATSEWFPTIAAIRSLTTQAGAPAIPDAGQAWGEVMAEIRRVGYCGTPRFTHPAVYAAVEALGWVDICASENVEATRAHFFRIYETTRVREAHVQSVAGIAQGGPKPLGLPAWAQDRKSIAAGEPCETVGSEEAREALASVVASLSRKEDRT